MYMTKEKFDAIQKKYGTLLVLSTDANDAMEFVRELLETEADALREKCVYAHRSIAEMEDAARRVAELNNDAENDKFGDGE